MAGFEVGELALHGVDEELDDYVAVAGFLADDLGELGADGVGGALGFGFGLPLRFAELEAGSGNRAGAVQRNGRVGRRAVRWRGRWRPGPGRSRV